MPIKKKEPVVPQPTPSLLPNTTSEFLTPDKAQVPPIQAPFNQAQQGVTGAETDIRAQQEAEIAGLQKPGPLRPERGTGPDIEFLPGNRGANITFDLGKVGEPPSPQTITLTEEQYNQYLAGNTKDPVVKQALEAKRAMGATSTEAFKQFAGEEQAQAQARLRPREQLTAPPITPIPGADIFGATVRESIIPALQEGAAAAGIAGGATFFSPAAPLAPFVAIGAFILGTSRKVYATYAANEREATKNIRKTSRLTRTAATITPTMMNRPGGIGKYQARLNLVRSRQQLNYEIDLAIRGREEGTLPGDLADADGLVGELIEFRDVYLPMLEQEVEEAALDPSLIPELMQIPGVTFSEPEE